MTRMIKAGDRVRVLDAHGHWHAATADSSVEGTRDGTGRKIHDFPVIWVIVDGHPDRMPWPQEAVDSHPTIAADQIR